MIKERLQEILEFTKSESPYSKANKGWINQDIFLEFGKSSSNLSKQREAAKVILLWPPIQKLISNLLLIITISSFLVLAALKGSQINLNLRSFIIPINNKLDKVETKKSILILEENQIIDNSFNFDSEEVLLKDEKDASLDELGNNEDSLKLDYYIAKDKKIELKEDSMEEKQIKKDIKIASNNKYKSNFF